MTIIIKNKHLSLPLSGIITRHAPIIARELGICWPYVFDIQENLPDAWGIHYHNRNRHIINVLSTCPRIVFTIAHELRHAWQVETDTLGPYDHVVDYDICPHELDANAYATAYCNRV